ncbi:hypothetical protein GTW69_41925, partial [Streptomyces sp. SID7760]|nr:hypothetical protein [Streptomyces sp. SID7760]
MGLQVDLAAAEAKQGPHAEEAVVAPVGQRVGHALDRHLAAREDEEAAGLPPVARTETQATTGDRDPLLASVASSETDPKPVEDSAAALWVFIGAVAVSLVIIGIGMNLRTGPA